MHSRCCREIQIFQQTLLEMRSLRLLLELSLWLKGIRAWFKEIEVHHQEEIEDHLQVIQTTEDLHPDKEDHLLAIQTTEAHHLAKEDHHQATQITEVHHKDKGDHLQVTLATEALQEATIYLATQIL